MNKTMMKKISVDRYIERKQKVILRKCAAKQDKQKKNGPQRVNIKWTVGQARTALSSFKSSKWACKLSIHFLKYILDQMLILLELLLMKRFTKKKKNGRKRINSIKSFALYFSLYTYTLLLFCIWFKKTGKHERISKWMAKLDQFL